MDIITAHTLRPASDTQVRSNKQPNLRRRPTGIDFGKSRFFLYLSLFMRTLSLPVCVCVIKHPPWSNLSSTTIRFAENSRPPLSSSSCPLSEFLCLPASAVSYHESSANSAHQSRLFLPQIRFAEALGKQEKKKKRNGVAAPKALMRVLLRLPFPFCSCFDRAIHHSNSIF